MGSPFNPADVLNRVNRDMERSLLRARNGVRFVRGTNRPKLGITPKEIVWQRDKAELWRYESGMRRIHPPLLIVHSLVSRSYILDLRPGHSAVEFLLGQGFDVYLLDWGVPDELDADNGFEKYVDEYIPRAVAAVLEESGADDVTIMGYCLGGVLGLLYASAYPDGGVRNLITLACPANFKAMGPFCGLLEEGRLNVDDLVDETGNVPADTLYSGFFMVAPTRQAAQYATLLDSLWNDEFVEGYSAMAQWSRDHVPFPGAAFRQMVEEFIRGEALVKGVVRLGKRRKIELADCQARFLSALAERDNVVPPPAVEPWMDVVGSPERREEMRLKGGHVTFGTGSAAFKHTLPRLSEWITSNSHQLAPSKDR
jgi:polyhydroxyalkanoate synthase subunit PhaC